MFEFASEEIASKYTRFWNSPIHNIMFTCYKRCDRDGKVKDASEEDERDVSVHPRMIYFFSHFAIHGPCVGEKFNASPLGYGIRVILPVD
jgi:mannose/cellobiose epimerase-like protein (N-acyl-D-glucosamine 2-epimerase family)